jgi:hypothetical protein
MSGEVDALSNGCPLSLRTLVACTPLSPFSTSNITCVAREREREREEREREEEEREERVRSSLSEEQAGESEGRTHALILLDEAEAIGLNHSLVHKHIRLGLVIRGDEACKEAASGKRGGALCEKVGVGSGLCRALHGCSGHAAARRGGAHHSPW